MLRFLLVYVFLLLHLQTRGQQKDTLFNQLYISPGIHYNIGNPFNPNWDLNNLLQIQAGINYVHGNLIVNMHGTKVKGKTSYPDFSLLYFTAGYDYHKPLFRNVLITCAFSAGNALMAFDDTSTPENLKTESELVTTINPQVLWRFGNHMGISAGYMWTRVYTQPRIDMQFAGFQLRYYLKTPKRMMSWLE